MSKKKDFLINIITNNNQYGLTNDASILVNNLNIIKEKTNPTFNFKVRPVSYHHSECSPVDINFFLELPNPLLLHSAKINILIPNDEWFYKSWIPYLNDFDEIWCKTNYSFKLFQNILHNNNQTIQKCKLIGWHSLDRLSNKNEKNYEKYLHIAGKSIYKGTKSLIESWSETFPELHIVYNNKCNKLGFINNACEAKKNIKLYPDRLSDEKLIDLMNTCGIHICPSEAEGFGHYINEARSCKSIIITTNAEPMKQFTEEQYLIDIDQTIPMKLTLGSSKIFNTTHFKSIIRQIIETDKIQLHRVSELSRQNYISDLQLFRKQLTDNVNNILNKVINSQYISKIPVEIRQK